MSPKQTGQTNPRKYECALPREVCEDFCRRHGCPSRRAKLPSNPAPVRSPPNTSSSSSWPAYTRTCSEKRKDFSKIKIKTANVVKSKTFENRTKAKDIHKLSNSSASNQTRIFQNKTPPFITKPFNPSILSKEPCLFPPKQSTCPPTSNPHISAIIDSLLNSMSQVPPAPSPLPNESIISIDNSMITDSFGDPKNHAGTSTTAILSLN